MTSTIIFYIVLVGLLIFLQWKVSLLRKGKIEIQTVHKDRHRKIKVIKQILRYVGHQIKDWLREGFIKFASWRIRAKARTNYFIESKLPGLYLILTKRPEIEEKHTKNIFWRGVIEYKYKIQKLKAQILEEEVQKIADKESIKESEKDLTKEVLQSETVRTYENIEKDDVAPITKNPVKKLEVLRHTEKEESSIKIETKPKRFKSVIKF